MESLREQFKRKKIGVLMGGLSSERDVSLKTGAAILGALQKKGYAAVSVDADRQMAESLRKNSIEAAFIALHGAFGEDGTVQGLLELLAVPYTGSGVLASALAINKVATKKMLAYHHLPTPAFQVLCASGGSPEMLADRVELPLPFVVKPSEEGSTIGISIVRKQEDVAPAIAGAARYDREILIEKCIQGRELTAGVLDGETLPLVEIIPEGGFYDYTAKYYSKGKTKYIVAPDIAGAKEKEIRDIAAAAFQAIGCSGAARVDFILSDAGDPFILEINTIPGMTETSLLPKAAQHAGIDFESLVERILWGAALHKKLPLTA